MGWTCRRGRRRARGQSPIKIIRGGLIPSRTQTVLEITQACNGYTFTVVCKLCDSRCIFVARKLKSVVIIFYQEVKLEITGKVNIHCQLKGLAARTWIIRWRTLFQLFSRFATKVVLPQRVLKSYARTQFTASLRRCKHFMPTGSPFII